MNIITPADLATRLDITREELAIAAQTCGVTAYLRARVNSHGSMNVCCTHGGKLERYTDTFKRVTGEELEPKRKRVAK